MIPIYVVFDSPSHQTPARCSYAECPAPPVSQLPTRCPCCRREAIFYCCPLHTEDWQQLALICHHCGGHARRAEPVGL